MRNFVAKNDFNRASTHRDKKNDYSRSWDLEDELDLFEDNNETSEKEVFEQHTNTQVTNDTITRTVE